MMHASFKSLLKRKNMAHLNAGEDSRSQPPLRRVAFVLLDNFSLMAFAGAVDALVTANLVTREPLVEVLVVGATSDLVVSDLGTAISTDCPLTALQEQRLDLLIMCGGFRVHLQSSPSIRSTLRCFDAAGTTLGGLWNGAFFLAEAGVLDGHDCAIHPDSRAMLLESFPGVCLSRHSYVLDRKRISCAGANSALSMMLDWLRRDHDQSFVDAIEEILNCDKAQEVMDVSVLSLDRDPTLPQALKLALELMHNNIDEPLSVDEIARWVNISRRQLERLFIRYVDASPSRYYMELRVTYARQLLQQTNKSIADIAVASGFTSIDHFRHCFRQFFHVAPAKFRRQRQP
ncbi:GlxA family transcriptional regulator [Halomonas kalidii]|uniref:GlxA family transcriptional regulator n=1 Tax=Halomonas kalidii TaxID=3043293 RepID=UPI0024A9F2AC|nr:GlxA family transcriptional regulator [Halomonas kalidii]